MNKNLDILKHLKEQGFKQTEVRTFIVSYLHSLKKPIDALTIQEALEQKVKKVNKTTIYRELEFLCEQKAILEINFNDGKKRYEIAGLPHHHHLICNHCQKVTDIEVENDLDQIEKKIKKQNNFLITKHMLEFFGVCKACLNK